MHPFFYEQLASERHARLHRDAQTQQMLRLAKLKPTNRLRVRPLQPRDIGRLAALYNGLSPRSRRLRFMAPIDAVPDEVVAHLAAVDHDEHEAIGAFDRGLLVASAHWFRSEHDTRLAHLATEVTDAYQRRGVGSRLLRLLGSRARASGIGEFRATVLAENAGAVALLRATGWPTVSRFNGPHVDVATRITD